MSTSSGLAALEELQKMGIPHRVFVHKGAVHSLEQAAEERGQQPAQVVRSLLFRLNEEEFALLLVAGPQQIPWKALRTYFNQRRLTLASQEEVFEQTGYRVGAVSPFGLARDLDIYIDETVFAEDEISMGSGQPGTAILMVPSDLSRALPKASHISLFS